MSAVLTAGRSSRIRHRADVHSLEEGSTDQLRDRSQQNWAELRVDKARARTNGGLSLNRTIDAASSSTIPNWLEPSLPAPGPVDP